MAAAGSTKAETLAYYLNMSFPAGGAITPFLYQCANSSKSTCPLFWQGEGSEVIRATVLEDSSYLLHAYDLPAVFAGQKAVPLAEVIRATVLEDSPYLLHAYALPAVCKAKAVSLALMAVETQGEGK